MGKFTHTTNNFNAMLRNMTNNELHEKLAELRMQLSKDRGKNALFKTQKVPGDSTGRLRKNIARCMTEMSKRGLFRPLEASP